MRNRGALIRTAISAAVAVTLAGCGGGDPGDEEGGGSSPSPEAGAETAVAVELGIWFVTADPASAPAGTVTFDVDVETEPGVPGHALTVLRTDLPPDGLPTNSFGQALTLNDDIEIIYSESLSSTSHRAEVELSPDSYLLICNIGDHYGRGMYTGFTVA